MSKNNGQYATVYGQISESHRWKCYELHNKRQRPKRGLPGQTTAPRRRQHHDRREVHRTPRHRLHQECLDWGHLWDGFQDTPMEYEIRRHQFREMYDQKQQRPVEIHNPGQIHEVTNLHRPHFRRILDSLRSTSIKEAQQCGQDVRDEHLLHAAERSLGRAKETGASKWHEVQGRHKALGASWPREGNLPQSQAWGQPENSQGANQKKAQRPGRCGSRWRENIPSPKIFRQDCHEILRVERGWIPLLT